MAPGGGVVDDLVVCAAGLLAGGVNALAGGGTIISFPVLLALGLPAVRANVTNTVALSPGYFAGTWAQRADLHGQQRALRRLALVAGAGGLAGSVVLLEIPAGSFKAAVPFLILAACALLLAQDRLRALIVARAQRRAPPSEVPAPGAAAVGEGVGETAAVASERPLPAPVELVAVFACSVYGGFFGAGLGIMLLAVLGLFSTTSLARTNAVKQALSLVINSIAALFFAFSGKVDWVDAGLLAVAAVAGASIGGRLVRRVDARLLRALVVLLGVAVAIRSWA